MLKLIFPNKSHKKLWEKLIREWGEKSAPEDLFSGGTFEGFLDLIEKDVVGTDKRVKSHLYFLFDNEIKGDIIGAIQIRHKVPIIKLPTGENEEVGHLGYGIAPKYRRKGYGSKMLGLALEKIKELKLDINKVLITCDVSNIGSAKVIENNGGVFERVNLRGKKRYWIDL